MIIKSHIKGDSFDGQLFSLYTTNNSISPQPIDLTGATINIRFFNDFFQTITNQYTNNNGIEIIDYANGEFILLKDVIIDWTIGIYYYDVKVTFPDNKIKTFINGSWSIINNSNINNNFPNLFVPNRINVKKTNNNSYYGGVCIGEDNICINKILYCNEPWVDDICAPYIINQSNIYPSLEFIIKQKGDFFGDQLYMDLTDWEVTIEIYNANDILRVIGVCDFIDRKNGFIIYKWDKFDTLFSGVYYANFILKNNKNNEEYIITNKNNRIEIIIN